MKVTSKETIIDVMSRELEAEIAHKPGSDEVKKVHEALTEFIKGNLNHFDKTVHLMMVRDIMKDNKVV